MGDHTKIDQNTFINILDIIIKDVEELKQVTKSLTGEIYNDPLKNDYNSHWVSLINTPFIYAQMVLQYHLPHYQPMA